MAIRRQVTGAVPDFSPETVAVLLGGWGAQAPVPGTHGFAHGFLELYEGDGHGPARDTGIIRMWTANRAWLLAQAQAWGWSPEWVLRETGERLFFGEWVSRGGPEQEHARRLAGEDEEIEDAR